MLSTNQTKTPRHWLTDLFLMAILLGVFYATWIGSHALFTPDEGRYSEVAREMVATGDYVTPRLNGVAFLDKPALYYWLQASAIQLFGLKEWSLRFWPAFMGVLGALITYLAGNFLFNRRTGFISGLILATCPLYYGAAHYANLDLEVAVLIGNSLLFFLMSTQLPLGKWRSASLITAYCFAGLAFLTKGLIGIVFPAMVMGSWIIILNRWSIIKRMHLIIGLILFACITTPWYVLAQKANPEFLHFFFVTQQVTRFLTKADFNNKAAWWFYIPIVLAGIFPWSIFIFQSLSKHFKEVWKNRQEHSSQLFLLIWLILIFTFFSIPKSKTVGYILPIFPAIALLIGSYLDSQWEKTKSKGIFAALVSLMVVSLGLTIGFLFAPGIPKLKIGIEFVPYLHAAAVLFSLSSFACLLLLRVRSFTKKFTVILSIACTFLLIMIASTPAINQRSIKPLTMELKALAKPDDEIVAYYKFYYDLPIYTEKRVTIVADWNAPDIEQNDNWLRELWYGMPFQNTQDWLIGQDTFLKRWNSQKRLFVVTDTSNYSKFKSVAKGKIYEIAQYKNVVVLSNKL